MNYEDAYAKIKEILVQSLNVDEEDIKPNQSLVADLNAESIDFLDITFRMEREFGFKIKNGDVFPTDIFLGQEDNCIKDGKVTAYGIALLKERIPYGTFAVWEQDPCQNTMHSIFTVESLAKFVQQQQTEL